MSYDELLVRIYVCKDGYLIHDKINRIFHIYRDVDTKTTIVKEKTIREVMDDL